MLRFFALLYFKFRQKFLQGKVIKNSKIDKSATIQSGTQIIDSQMGRHSYAAYDCLIVNCSIGSFCSIAPNVTIGAAEHPMEWASTSPAFEGVRNSSPRKRFAHFPIPQSKRTVIGSDVWIGQDCIIKAGVEVGHGAVIGAGAVVTKDVEPYAVVGGCPAKIIKYRFDNSVKDALLSSEWWNLSDEQVSAIATKVMQPLEFAMAALAIRDKN